MPVRMIWQDERGYEVARRATMWNARVPHRFPKVIALAADVDDVVEAVKLAPHKRLRIRVFGVGIAGRETDATTMAAAAVVLATVAVIAGYLLARRASRVDPTWHSDTSDTSSRRPFGRRTYRKISTRFKRKPAMSGVVSISPRCWESSIGSPKCP